MIKLPTYPFRWIAATVSIGCIILSICFITNDAPYADNETVVFSFMLAAGLLLGIGTATLQRRLFLGGIFATIVAFSDRMWDLIVVGDASWQIRCTGVAVYFMLAVYTLGLGMAYIRWEATGGRRQHS